MERKGNSHQLSDEELDGDDHDENEFLGDGQGYREVEIREQDRCILLILALFINLNMIDIYP